MGQFRIVSLLASATEIVCALEFEDSLVGRSHECDFPPSIKSLPVCTKVKFDPDGRSYEIDARVKGIVQEALSVYQVDSRILKELSPTHLITQVQCEVCAVSLKDVEKAVQDLVHSKPSVISLNPDSLEGVFKDIEKVAKALEAAESGKRLISSMKGKMGLIQQQSLKAKIRPTAACIEWIEPLMAAGNWMPELVEMAGGMNVFGEAGKHSPWMTWEDLVKKNPDILLILPCGFGIHRILQEMDLLSSKPEWELLKAVHSENVFLLDGNQYFNRPGPRLLESLEILAEIFHPNLQRFGHEGTGWIRWKSLQS